LIRKPASNGQLRSDATADAAVELANG